MQNRARRAEDALLAQAGLHIADHLQPLLHCGAAWKDAAHRMRRAGKVDKLIHEIHIAATFGVDGHASSRCLPDALPHNSIRRELRGKHLGEPTADQHTVYRWQRLVMQRTEGNERRPQLFEHTQTRRIVKAERLITRYADAQPTPRLQSASRSGKHLLRPADVKGGRGLCQMLDGRQIQRRRDHLSHAPHLGRSLELRRRREAEMTFWQHQARIAMHRAVDRQMDARHRRADHRLMRCRTKAVEQYARERHLRIIHTETERSSRCRSSHRLRVDDEEHRRIEFLGNLCRRTHALPPAVVESHDAFNDSDIRISSAKAPKNLSKQYLSYMVKQLFSKESKNLSHPSAYMQATATSYRATARDSFLLNRLASMAEMTASVESSLIQPKNLLSSDLDVRFDLVSCETGEPINPEVDVFTNCYVRVTNRTEEPLYVNVLDIDERGNKYLVLPVDEAATCAHLLVPAGCTVAFKSEPFEFSEANSRETFLLVATEEPVDFSILMSPIRGNGGDQMKSGIYRVSYLTK